MFDRFGRNHSLASRFTKQHALHDITGGLTVGPAGPSVGCISEAFSFPPSGVTACQMTCRFERACNCFTHTVGSHKQPFFILHPRAEKLDVLLIKFASKRP